MNDTPRRERRSPVVVLLDAALALAAALQTGHLPGRRAREGAPARRGAGVVWLTAGIIVAIAGTVLVAVTIIRTPGGLASLPPTAAEPPPPASAAPSPAATPGSTATSTSPASPSASSPATRSSSAAPSGTTSASRTRPGSPAATVALPLTARYAADAGGAGLLFYRSTVTISNPAGSPRTGWSLTVTLPRPTLVVDEVTGATAEQDGSTWTFTPDGSTARVPAAGTVAVAFTVRGATLLDAGPRDCRIDDEPCSGLRD